MGHLVNLTFRKAFVADIPQLIDLAKEIWLPTFAVYFSETELNSLFSGMYNTDRITADLQNPHYALHIVENTAQKPVGYFATAIKPTYLKLDKIYVSPKLQGQGIGKWIFDEIVRQAREQSLDSIQLNVNRRNAPAISFYKKLGFKIIRSEDIPGPNGFVYDDFVMEFEVSEGMLIKY
ncbi:GNAT family N-acetyltransferase [Cryomorpha ignava]|uniref:GNAT family N-acetyltransferase n=1 Tax=Cryomorpha ignava TaxID=101383 RepID=A0A7K3WQU2_9FLAO|nr:GNAT family N-acetyltransferase [Cryomorpha ignava]NEN23886.1 GNAT family N-acetyltransferase [Cryomorpha ignava]